MTPIRRILVAALLLLALPARAAPTPITVWHAYRGATRTALETVASRFNATHADLRIELLAIPYDAFADKITTAIPRGEPDLFIFAQDRLGDWAASGLVESVDFWVAPESRAEFLAPTIDALTYEEQLYGLPISFATTALIRNTRLVPDAPQTTDELIATARRLTDAKASRFGFAYENASFYFHAAWFQGFGARVFDGRVNPQLDSPEAIASLAFARRLAHDEGVMPQEISSALVTSLFNQGRAAMVISGSWFLGEIDKDVPFAVSPLPAFASNGERPRPFLTAEGVLMSARSPHKREAFRVMQYLTSTEAGLVLATQGRQASARRDVYDDPTVRRDAALLAFREQLAFTIPMPNTPAMRAVWTPATVAMNQVINGASDPAKALHEAQAEVVKALRGARR